MPLTRSSQRLLLLKTSPRKVLSSVSNILLDPNSHQAHQIVRRNGASSGHSLAISRSSNAVLQSSKSGHTNSSNDVRQISSSCKREMVKSQQTVDASPSKLRHNLFTQVINCVHKKLFSSHNFLAKAPIIRFFNILSVFNFRKPQDSSLGNNFNLALDVPPLHVLSPRKAGHNVRAYLVSFCSAYDAFVINTQKK